MKGIHFHQHKEFLPIDATPDAEYPIRILQEYRRQCDVRVSDRTDTIETDHPMLKQMNEDQEKRTDILDRAITILYQALL